MKLAITPLALALMAGTLYAQTPADAEKRIAELEKKVAKLSKDEGKKEEAKDSGFSVKYGGRVHLDSVYFSGGQNRLPNGTFLRRARISWKVNAGKNWMGEGDVDFAESSVNVKDLWLGYTGIKDALVQIGQFKVPFGMDTLTSSNNTWMTERSFSDIWTPDRHVGIAYSTWGERWHVKADFFGQAIDDTSDIQEAADENTIDTGLTGAIGTTKDKYPATAKTGLNVPYKVIDNQGYGYAARFVFLPVLVSETKLVHLGVAGIQRKPNAGAPGTYAVDFSGRPEQNKVSRAKFVGASVNNVDKWTQTGLEFAGLWGPFSWQSEYQTNQVNRLGAATAKWDGTAMVATSAAEQLASTVNHKFSTYYAQVSWIFGGQRTYEIQDGIFKGVAVPKKGALEVALRVSQMNQDDLTSIDPVKGGIVKNTTLGLTYYVNRSIRFMLDYTKVDPNENSAPSSAYSPTGKKIYNDDFNITSFRMQYTF